MQSTVDLWLADTKMPHSVFNQPWYLIRLGAYEEAIALIEQYVDEDVADSGSLNTTDFDAVHEDPRFQAVLKRLNLAD